MKPKRINDLANQLNLNSELLKIIGCHGEDLTDLEWAGWLVSKAEFIRESMESTIALNNDYVNLTKQTLSYEKRNENLEAERALIFNEKQLN